MAKKEELSYEEAKKRIEKMLADIDSGNIGMDELETTLAEAKKLIEFAMKRLANAEKVILGWED